MGIPSVITTDHAGERVAEQVEQTVDRWLWNQALPHTPYHPQVNVYY